MALVAEDARLVSKFYDKSLLTERNCISEIIRRRKAQLAFPAAATIPRLHREFVMVEISTTRL